MVSQEVVEKARQSIVITERYDAQELFRVGGVWSNMRRDWTPAQIRRMNKRYNKMNMTNPNKRGS